MCFANKRLLTKKKQNKKRQIIRPMALWRRQSNTRLGVEGPYGGHYDLRTMLDICEH